MAKILTRLPKLTDTQELIVLTFLSCVGMLQNGDYVTYNEVGPLVSGLPLSQAKMQGLHLQSNYSLPRVGRVVMYKLHEDIPHKLDTKKLQQGVKRKTEEDEKEEESLEVPEEDVQEVRVDIPPACPPTGNVRYLPVSCKMPWTQVEEGMISLDNKGQQEAYAAYSDECRKRGGNKDV